MDIAKLNHLIEEGKKGLEYHKSAFNKILDDFLLRFQDKESRALSNLRKSHLFLPVIASKVRRILCSFQEAYFSNEDIIKISCATPFGSEVIETLQDAFNYYINNKIEHFMPLTQSMLQSILLGTTILKCFWAGESPKIENVSIFDCYFDPSAYAFKDIKYMVHVIQMSRMDMLEFAESGVFSDINFEVDENIYKKETLYEVYYYLNQQWHLATIYNQNKIREMTLNDGLPFVVGTLIPQMILENEKCVRVYGDSPTAILCSLQREINIRRNQQIDAISLALSPRILIEEGSLIDPNALMKGAGEIISCADPNGIKFVPAPSMQEGIFDVNRLDIEAQEAIGVTNYNSGVSTNNLNQTATGISVLSSEANTRIQSLIRAYNETLMQPLMTRIAKLIYKYDPLFMGNFATRTPLEIIAKINTGIGATNPQTQIQNLDKAFMMFMQTQNIYGATKIVEDMLPILGIKNKQDYTQQMPTPQQQGVSNGG